MVLVTGASRRQCCLHICRCPLYAGEATITFCVQVSADARNTQARRWRRCDDDGDDDEESRRERVTLESLTLLSHTFTRQSHLHAPVTLSRVSHTFMRQSHLHAPVTPSQLPSSLHAIVAPTYLTPVLVLRTGHFRTTPSSLPPTRPSSSY